MLILKQDGIYAECIDGIMFKLTKDDDILVYLHDAIKQEGGITFRELMNLLEPFLSDIKHIYKTIINGCQLELFFEEVKNEKNVNIEGLNDIKFKWILLTDQENYFDIAPKIRLEETISKFIPYRPLTLTALNDIGSLPIFLDESVVFEKPYKKIWDLYNIIESLMYEICAFKTPEERNTRNKMVLKSIDDVSITFKCDTWDDFEQNGILLEEADLAIKHKELYEAIEYEEYEKAAILKDQIDELVVAIEKIKNPTN